MTHSEVNIKYFVKNSPVFMNDEDRKRSLQKAKPIIGKSQLLTKAIDGRKSSNSINTRSPLKKSIINLKPTHPSFISDHSTSINLLGSSFKSPDKLNESSIKDLEGYKRKTEMKLNEIINPTADAVAAFDTGKSPCFIFFDLVY